MSNEEREKVRQAGAEDARRSRVQRGLAERIQDPAAVAMLAAILRGTPVRQALSGGSSNEGKPAA